MDVEGQQEQAAIREQVHSRMEKELGDKWSSP